MVFFASIDQGHFPRLAARIVIFDAILAHVESDIGLMQKIIREVFLDHVALIAKADDELVHCER